MCVLAALILARAMPQHSRFCVCIGVVVAYASQAALKHIVLCWLMQHGLHLEHTVRSLFGFGGPEIGGLHGLRWTGQERQHVNALRKCVRACDWGLWGPQDARGTGSQKSFWNFMKTQSSEKED